jgi:S-adenosylmethionine-diacylgycerolhomoserine-N-methlytransferase
MVAFMSIPAAPSAKTGHFGLMDKVYQRQRYVYDFTRKYYLVGRDSLIRDLNLKPGARLVEIGCGTGRNLIAIARRYPGARLYGLDASGEMLKTAAAQLARAGLTDRVVLVHGLAENLAPAQFGQDGFDHALFSYSLSMIPDWRKAIVAAAKALNDNGLIHIVDFGDLKSLPGKSLLRGWLSLFHVTPRTELLAGLEAIFAKAGEALRLFPGRYAFRLSAPKGKMGSLSCGSTDTGWE